MVLRQSLVIIVAVVAVYLGYVIGAPLLGELGGLAKSGEGTNGEGFDVDEETVDEGAEISLVWVPTTLVGGIGLWAFISVFAILGYRGLG